MIAADRIAAELAALMSARLLGAVEIWNTNAATIAVLSLSATFWQIASIFASLERVTAFHIQEKATMALLQNNGNKLLIYISIFSKKIFIHFHLGIRHENNSIHIFVFAIFYMLKLQL